MLGQNNNDFNLLFWPKVILIATLNFLEISWEVATLMMGCVLVDTFFGLIKSIRLDIRLEFHKFIWGLITKFSILFMPFFIAILGKFLGHDFTYMVNVFIYIIIANDSFSIITNILSIKTQKFYKNEDFIEVAMNALRGVFKTGIMNMIDKIKSGEECQIKPDEDANEKDK